MRLIAVMSLVVSNTPCTFSVLRPHRDSLWWSVPLISHPSGKAGLSATVCTTQMPSSSFHFLRQLLGMSRKPHKVQQPCCISLPSIPITLGDVPSPHFTWSYWNSQSWGLSPFILPLGGHISYRSGTRGWFRNGDGMKAESLESFPWLIYSYWEKSVSPQWAC